jgi:SAM-dependent methyltransferase
LQRGGSVAAVFREEAAWIRWRLGRLDLPEGGRVADIGSSTLFARAVGQPHVESEVLRPLRERGLSIVHVDAVEDAGVDVTADLADPATDLPAALGDPFDLVLCLSMLAFVRDLPPVIANVVGCVAPGGHLLVTTPLRYRVTKNPVDNRWRPNPEELLDRLSREGGVPLEPVALASLTIHDNHEYLPFLSRLTTTYTIAGKERRVPGGFDQLRRLGDDTNRWAQTCVLARRPA